MVSGGNQSSARRGGGHVKILHINDHHSYIEGDVFKLDTSKVLKDTRQVEMRYGGLPRIATVMQQLADSSTLKFHAGDAITGTMWYSMFKGSADAAMMGQVCFANVLLLCC